MKKLDKESLTADRFVDELKEHQNEVEIEKLHRFYHDPTFNSLFKR